MATMALDNQIISALELLRTEEKQSLMGVINTFLKLHEDAPARTTIEEYNKEGHDAVERVKNGQFYTQEEIERMSEEW